MTVTNHPRSSSQSTDQSGPGRERSRVLNGLVGGAVAVLLSVLPLSPAIGGGVAGYLDRETGRHGAAAGTIAGLVAAIPYVLVGLYLALSPGVTLPGPELGVSRALIVAGVTGFALVYVVGLAALGSLGGGFLRDHLAP